MTIKLSEIKFKLYLELQLKINENDVRKYQINSQK